MAFLLQLLLHFIAISHLVFYIFYRFWSGCSLGMSIFITKFSSNICWTITRTHKLINHKTNVKESITITFWHPWNDIADYVIQSIGGTIPLMKKNIFKFSFLKFFVVSYHDLLTLLYKSSSLETLMNLFILTPCSRSNLTKSTLSLSRASNMACSNAPGGQTWPKIYYFSQNNLSFF